MEQWQISQANCIKTLALQKKKLEAFKYSLQRLSKEHDDHAKLEGFCQQIEEHEKQIKDMGKSLPVNIG